MADACAIAGIRHGATEVKAASYRVDTVSLPNISRVLAAKGEDGRLAVLVLNVFEDAALSPRILLDRPVRVTRFVGCEGKAEGNCVTLSDIPAFGAAAFEVE